MKKQLITGIVTAAACLMAVPPAVADQLEDIQAAGVLKVGVEGTFAPFTYHDESGELVGFDVEIAKALAEKLGVEAEFTETKWDSLLAAIDSGRLDTVINDVTVTEERGEKYDFSQTYYYSVRQIVVAADNDDIHSMEDLSGKKCATTMTNSFVPQLEEAGATVVPISTSEEAAVLVTTGRADFCLFNPAILGEYLAHQEEAAIKLAFVIPGDDEEIAVPVRKGEETLLNAINEAFDEMREDGTLVALSEKYFGGDYTVPSTAAAEEEVTEAATEAE